MFEFLTPSTLNSVGTGMNVFGSVFGGLSDIAAGKQQRENADFEAAQYRQKAGQAQASSQREAFTADQQAKYIASRALAVAAASGGGASDPTVVHIISGIAGEGAYRQALALYQGEELARQLNTHADAIKASGAAAERSGLTSGIGKFIGAGTGAAKGIARGQSLYDKYSGGGPSMDAGSYGVDMGNSGLA